MRFAAAPLIISLALLASPAFAQNGGGDTGANSPNPQLNETTGPSSATETGTDNQGTATPGAMNNHSSAATNMQNWQNNARVTRNTEWKIRQSLADSGFKDIRIMPQAYVIHAQAPDGSRVVMEVAPDQFAAMVQPNAASGSSMNNSSSNPNDNSQGMNPNAPSNGGNGNASGSDTNH